MKVVHRITIIGQCPKGCSDIYQAEFHTNQTIMVEDIGRSISLATKTALTQEELTQRLADLTDCRVVTHGTHQTKQGPFETMVEVDGSTAEAAA